MFIVNILLVVGIEYRNKKIMIISKEYLKIKHDIVNCQNITEDMLHIVESNMKQSYFPLFIKSNEFKRELEKSSSPKLYVRFNMNFCGSCLNEMYVYLEEIASEIGTDKIILLPICKDEKEFKFFQKKYGTDFSYIDIKSEELYIENILEPVKPYFFVYERNLKFPILFSWFYNEFLELNELYKKTILDFFSYERENFLVMKEKK